MGPGVVLKPSCDYDFVMLCNLNCFHVSVCCVDFHRC